MFGVTTAANRPLCMLVLAIALAGCSDGKPPHYYVLCEASDSNGWRLVASYKNEAGYLLSCTYQSPDQRQTYTATCRASGCD